MIEARRPARREVLAQASSIIGATLLGVAPAAAQTKEQLLRALLNARSSEESTRIGNQLVALYQRNIAEASDPVYAAAARLDLYSAYANRCGSPQGGRWEACRALLRTNSNVMVRMMHRPVWTGSRSFMAGLYLGVRDRAHLQSFLREATRAANDAYDNIEDMPIDVSGRFLIYRYAIATSLMNGRTTEALQRFARAVREIPSIVAAQQDGWLTADALQSSNRNMLTVIYQLGAYAAAKAGDASTAWRWFEASKQLSSDAGAYSPQPVPPTQDAVNLAASCLGGFHCVAALVQCDAGAAWLLLWKGPSGEVRTHIADAVAEDGSPFDVVTENALRYGRPWMDLNEGFGGWLAASNYELREGGAGGAAFRGQLETVSRQLWNACGRSLAHTLPTLQLPADAKVAVLTPDQIALMPISLAWSAEDSTAPGSRYVVYTAGSVELLASSLRRYPAVPQQRRVIGVFNPTSDLPFAALEQQFVQRAFGAQSFTRANNAATPQAFWRQVATSQARYIWFAAHGTFAMRDQNEAGLLIAPSKYLRLSDIRSADFAVPPRLVVLSACQTAQVQQRMGMSTDDAPTPASWPSALLRAGAIGVVASHWSVSDLSTALFFSRMLEIHARPGQDPAVAFHDAQTWLRTSSADAIVAACESLAVGLPPSAQRTLEVAIASIADTPDQNAPFAHPYYWAAFSYFGA